MPAAIVKVDLEQLEPVKRTMKALMRLLHEVECCDPTLLPYSLRDEAANARAIVDEWRMDGRHRRRHDR